MREKRKVETYKLCEVHYYLSVWIHSCYLYYMALANKIMQERRGYRSIDGIGISLGIVGGAAESNSVLGLVHEGLVIVVRVARDGVAHLLSARLLALGLEGGGNRVACTLDAVADVLGGGLLGVRLHGRASLVGEGLTASVRHGDLKGFEKGWLGCLG